MASTSSSVSIVADALLVVEHRQLAEDVAGPEVGERDRAAVDVLADRAGVAAADDVARVGRVALAEDHGAAGEVARDGDVGDAARGPPARAPRTPAPGRAARLLWALDWAARPRESMRDV